MAAPPRPCDGCTSGPAAKTRFASRSLRRTTSRCRGRTGATRACWRYPRTRLRPSRSPTCASSARRGRRATRTRARTATPAGPGRHGSWPAGIPASPSTRRSPTRSRARADPRCDDVLGTEAKPEYGLENPLLRLGVERRDGQRVEYLLGKAPEQEEYTLKVSTRPEHFRLAGWRSRSLVEAASRDALLGSGDDGKEDEPSDSPSGGAEGKDSEAADESGTTGD